MPQRQILAFGLGLVAAASLAAADLPCDTYGQDPTTPCVAAHSTVRALYSSFNGSLYEVTRADGATLNITVMTGGGVANAASQDSFCAGSSCVISTIYDQSPNGNHLTAAPPGGNANGTGPNMYDTLSDATAAPITVNGIKAYGVYIAVGNGYRNDATTGIAIGDDPEGMYAVVDGTHFNNGCCFDYGNAETDNIDHGPGTMETINFSNTIATNPGSGAGPWVQTDLEDGLFAGGMSGVNEMNPSLSFRFVTAMVKGGHNIFSIKGGDATADTISLLYNGTRPNGYQVMAKQGAIILGIGGDNSNFAEGTWYEGAITTGYPTDTTEGNVQLNIQSAGYAAS